MQFELQQEYGKQEVQLVKIYRNVEGRDELYEYKVKLVISGTNFHASYTKADNKDIIATDTMKNIIYYIANEKDIRCPDKFAMEISDFITTKYASLVECVKVCVECNSWDRILKQNSSEPTKRSVLKEQEKFAFEQSINDKRKATLVTTKTGTGYTTLLSVHICDWQLLKSRGSSFANFYTDEFRTLPDAKDRILKTKVQLRMDYKPIKDISQALNREKSWYCGNYQKMKDIVLEEFCRLESASVQSTLYAIATKILSFLEDSFTVEVELPNQHVFLVDMPLFKKDGFKPVDDVYVPLSSPSGIIKASVSKGKPQL